ncbi:MAG: DUF2155 domain-containing protein [Alphaproteobacteria bacterium]|nr:DUF2155 domain-containing protein [Alphaproteobacteria bacterium]
MKRVRAPSVATAFGLAAVLWVLPTLAQQAGDGPSLAPPASPGAVLQGLDKVTARISSFPVSTEEEVRFGTLSIRVRACHKAPPTEPPESTAFLEISDIRPGDEPVPLFSGWMFASSPALSALEHPVYDVWVVDCMNASNSSPESSD